MSACIRQGTRLASQVSTNPNRNDMEGHMAHDPQNAASDPQGGEMTDAELDEISGAGSSNAAGSPSYFDQNS